MRHAHFLFSSLVCFAPGNTLSSYSIGKPVCCSPWAYRSQGDSATEQQHAGWIPALFPFLLDFPLSTLPASPLSPCLPPSIQMSFIYCIFLPPGETVTLSAFSSKLCCSFCQHPSAELLLSRLLKLSKSLIVCPNLERRLTVGLISLKNRMFYKIFQLKDKWTRSTAVDVLQWRKLFKNYQ